MSDKGPHIAVGAVFAKRHSHAQTRTPGDDDVIAYATDKYVVIDTAQRFKALMEALQCTVYTYGNHARQLRQMLSNEAIINVSTTDSRMNLWLEHQDHTRMQDVHYYEAPLEPTRVQRSAHDQIYVSIGNLTAESRFLHTHSSTQQEMFENDKLWIADAKACLRMRSVAPQAEASGLGLTHTPEGVEPQGHETSQEKPDLFHARKRARETEMQEDDTDLNSSSTQSKQQSLNQISTAHRHFWGHFLTLRGFLGITEVLATYWRCSSVGNG